MKDFKDKVITSKKTALFAAIVFLFVTVFSIVPMGTAYAENNGLPAEALISEPGTVAEPSPEPSPVLDPITEPGVDPGPIAKTGTDESTIPSPEPSIKPIPSPAEPSMEPAPSTDPVPGPEPTPSALLPTAPESPEPDTFNERIYVYNAKNASSVTVNYSGTSLTCSKDGTTWKTNKGLYDQSGVNSVTVNGSITIPRAQLSVQNSSGGDVKVYIPRPDCTVYHKYYSTTNGVDYVLDDTDTVKTDCYLLETIDSDDIDRDFTNDGKTYTYYGIEPEAIQTVGISGVTFTISYRLPYTTYTVEHKYYTSTNGGPFLSDGTVTNTVGSYVGAWINPFSIASQKTYGGKNYEHILTLPVIPQHLVKAGSSGVVFTLTYKRCVSTYTVVHEYYTKTDTGPFVKDGSTEETLTGCPLQIIDLDGIPRVPTYLENPYTYKSIHPLCNPILPICGGLKVTLRYERCLSTYSIVHEYYTGINGGAFGKDGESAAIPMTGYVNSTVDLDAIAKAPDFDSNTYTFDSYDPPDDPTLTGAGGLVIKLKYNRSLQDYTIAHEYYTSVNGGAFTKDGATEPATIRGNAGQIIDLEAIAKVSGFGGNTYIFDSFDPAANPTLTAGTPLAIKLIYKRSITLFKIVTSCSAGGTITETQTNIPGGSQRTITYTPNAGYHVLSVTVDGAAVNIQQHPLSYTFSDIRADHIINAIFEADPVTGTISIIKVDAATQARLPGAVFNIYSDSGLSKLAYSGLTSNANGEASAVNVPAGNYWIKETAPPAGYTAFTGTIPVTVTAGKTSTVTIPNTGELGFGTGALKIVKTDGTTGAALKNAKFNVYSDSARTTLFGKLTTNSAGVAILEGLEPGTYYIVETAAPTGYKKISGALTAVVISNETTTLNIKNSKTEEEDYQTGTDDYNKIIAGGILLIIGLGLIFLYRRKARA